MTPQNEHSTHDATQPTTLSIEVDGSEAADELAQALQQFTHPAPTAVTQFEIPDPDNQHPAGWRIDAYFDAPPDIEVLHAHLKAAPISNLPDITLKPTPDLNWVALSQAGLKPVKAGRFLVHGSHDRHLATFSNNAIEIDAGEAFGTAHHATTYLCLKAIDAMTRKRNFKNALDLGCGSGVLAIALARAAPNCQIIATDIDQEAIRVTTENLRINRVTHRINAFAANGLSHPAMNQRARFDLIIANILAGPLIELANALATTAKPGADIVLSGILTHQARQVTAAYVAARCTLTHHHRHAEWSALIFKKY